jgi:HlyD family secretion protein
MNVQRLRDAALKAIRQNPKLAAAAAIGGIALLMAALFARREPAPEPLSFYQVKRADFLVSIIEGGTLEAVNEVSIRSEVEGTARIIYIVPEGSYVKKNELLVELDSSSSEDAVNQQQINVEKAEFTLLQAEQQFEIQKSTVESEIQAATLRVEFAQSDLEKFTKGESLQSQRNAQIEITNVLENLHIAQERLDWSEKLYEKGFETKANLDKDRLTVSQSKLKLEQAQKALWMVETFDNPKRKRSLESALQEANENLERVKLQGERKLAQFEADVETQKKTLELSQTKLEREKKQLLATKIYAPQDGLVVYASAGGGHFSSESMIEEGAVIRNRQEIIKLPDVSEMKLQVKIHESHITQVRPGQPAFVVLDSMPDQRFRGAVNRVAPLPDSQSRWGNPDLKLYATEILITDALPDIKPGVSARAEVVITNLPGVLAVPIQAVTTRKMKQVVFLAGAPQEPVPVTIGMFNSKLIEIISGLKEGDQVLLAPPLDTKEKDLGGSILVEGESAPGEATNPPAQLVIHTNGNGKGPGDPGALPSPSTNRVEVIKRVDADGNGALSEPEPARKRSSLTRQRVTNGAALN